MSQSFEQLLNNTGTSSSGRGQNTGTQNAAADSMTAVLPLTDEISGNLDVEYYGPLLMGTTNQRMTVDVDTGSADLWVRWSVRSLLPTALLMKTRL